MHKMDKQIKGKHFFVSFSFSQENVKRKKIGPLGGLFHLIRNAGKIEWKNNWIQNE